MDIKNVDIAALSPSLSKARFQDNLGVALINLAKKQMNVQSEMLGELLDTGSDITGIGEQVDVKL